MAEIKAKVHDYWQSNICETKKRLVNGDWISNIPYPAFSKEYFKYIEENRIASRKFAQPEKYKGKQILEVGVGSGVDFVQFVRQGAIAHGIDLTEAAINHTTSWLIEDGKVDYDCEPQFYLRVCDAEKINYPDNYFDLVYSWGVLHHTPDTLEAISECVRVCKPGSEIKLMLYNRDSLLWNLARIAQLVLRKDIESPNTKAFTYHWCKKLEKRLPVKVEEIKQDVCEVDLIPRYGKVVYYGLKAYHLFDNEGFFRTIILRKNG